MPLVKFSDDTYDFIVVGAGAAGCVVANRISRFAKVLLIEAGGLDSSWEVLMPQNCGRLWGDEKYSWGFRSTQQKELGGKERPCYVGKGLGGSSSCDNMTWMRGHCSDYNNWAKLGLEGWSYKDVMSYFKRIEDCNFKCDVDIRGSKGPIKLSRAPSDEFTENILAAAETMGYDVTDDLNCGSMEGFCRMESNTHQGVRCSPSHAFLHPVRSRYNLHVLCNTVVTKVVVENHCAKGVQFISKEGESQLEVSALKEVILCCGSILTPKLMMLSGLGKREELAEHGIECLRSLPGVGKNLQCPLNVAVTVPTKRNYWYYGVYENTHKELAHRDWFVGRNGPHSSTGFSVMCSVKTNESEKNPNINIAFNRAILEATSNNDFQFDHDKTPGYTALVSTNHVFSKGHVVLKSSDPLSPPVIDMEAFADTRDQRNLLEGVKLANSLFQHDFLSEEVIGPSSLAISRNAKPQDEDLLECMRETVRSNGCYSGSCKMGSYTDEMSVTDKHGRVWGIGKLRLVDSSIIPEAPSTPCLTPVCCMIAEKLCDVIEKAYAGCSFLM